jgi:putative spermidine/putrescine transport system substrate-binding protein
MRSDKRRPRENRGGRLVAVLAATVSLLAACTGSASTSAPASQAASSSAASSAPTASTAATAPTTTGHFTYLCATGTFAEAIKKAYVEPFQQKTGIQVTCDERDPTTEMVKAAVDTKNYAFDATLAFSGIPKEDWPKYFEKLDFSVINKDEIDPHWISDYWVVSDIAAEVLTYNLDATKGVKPTGLADLFDTNKIPGKRCFEDNYATAYAWALMADGVPPDKLMPYDVQRAQKKLATIKDKIIWFTTGTQIQEYIASGECPIGIAWNGRARAAANQGHKVEVLWNPQILTYDRTAILKGSPNKDAAMQFLGFMTAKDVAGDLTKYVPYVPANKSAVIDPATKDWAPHLDQPAFIPDYDYWDSTFKEMDAGFQAFKQQ